MKAALLAVLAGIFWGVGEFFTKQVLHTGRVHDDAQQQPERIDEDVVLDAFDLLARVEPDRIDRRPPFSAAFTDLLSRIAAVGLASLPACARQAT